MPGVRDHKEKSTQASVFLVLNNKKTESIKDLTVFISGFMKQAASQLASKGELQRATEKEGS